MHEQGAYYLRESILRGGKKKGIQFTKRFNTAIATILLIVILE